MKPPYKDFGKALLYGFVLGGTVTGAVAVIAAIGIYLMYAP